jgi:hypothetical protein
MAVLSLQSDIIFHKNYGKKENYEGQFLLPRDNSNNINKIEHISILHAHHNEQ